MEMEMEMENKELYSALLEKAKAEEISQEGVDRLLKYLAYTWRCDMTRALGQAHYLFNIGVIAKIKAMGESAE